MRALALFIVLLAFAAPAAASPSFPPEMDAHLALGYEPVCTICHSTLLGGLGTVVQPFGIKMQSRGLQPADLQSLRNALTALEAEGSDVDEDGVGDVQELRDGTNPNLAGGLEDPPEYGCLGNVAPTRSVWPGATLALAALAILVRRRRV